MIVVDSSVFVCMIQVEPEAETFAEALGRARGRCMSAGNYLECAMIAISRLGGIETLDEWLQRRRVDIVPVDRALARLAGEAFGRFGRTHHKAGLNYGDCFAYALAKARNAPLLYKGGDFGLTDLQPASP
jgi:ribonuclease VapC